MRGPPNWMAMEALIVLAVMAAGVAEVGCRFRRAGTIGAHRREEQMMLQVEGTDQSSSGRAMRVARLPVLLLGMVVVVSACGSSDGATDGSETTATTAPVATSEDGAVTTAAPTTAAPATTQPAGEGDTTGVSVATVSIAGETYEFQDTGFIAETCDTSFFGGAQVILFMADENGEAIVVDSKTSTLSIVLIPEGVGDTPDAVNLGTMDADRDWIADRESLVVEGTQVDSWSIDGNRIEGTATFASTAGEGPSQGTFEVTCAEE